MEAVVAPLLQRYVEPVLAESTTLSPSQKLVGPEAVILATGSGFTVTNVGTDDIELNAGDKIVQFLLLPVAYEPVEVVNTFEELFEGQVTERGAGGFGSTGEK